MEINPQSSLIVPNGIISGDDRNPIYLGYGGMVTLLPFNSIYLSGLELWEESLGKIVDASNGADSIFLGSFEQWHQLIFYIKDVSTGEKYYPELTTERMGETDELVLFYPSHIQGDPYPPDPEYAWIMHLQINPNLSALPPQEILDYYGNPFTPSGEINIPVNGKAYAIIKKAVNTGINLFTDMPTDKQIASDVKEAINDTFWLGEKLAGSKLRFYIKSPNALLNGVSLYADNVVDVSQTDEGELLLGRLNFEDGTDELFDDEQVEIFLHPDDVGDFPSPVSVVFSKTELAPGDTAQIEIKHRFDDGTIGDFPPDQYFDIEIIKNMDYGTLYSSYEDSKSYSFFAPGSFSFIAKDSIDVDSIKAIVRVGTYYGEIIYSKPIKKQKGKKLKK